MRSRVAASRWIVLTAFLALWLTGSVSAFQGDMGFHYALPKGSSVHSDLYLFGWNVDVQGEVDGDLFALGGVVHVHGPVRGNVYLAGGQVEIDGPVTGDINVISLNAESKSACRACRILALDGAQEGDVRGDLLALAVLMEAEGNVKEDTLLAGDQVSIAGDHAGRFLCVAKKLSISGTIQGTSDLTAGSITLEPAARLVGHVVYTSPDDIDKASRQMPGGFTHYYPPPRFLGVLHFPWLYTLVHKVLSAIWLTVVGLFAVTTWLKRPSRSIIDAMLDYPWESFGVGLLVCVAVPGIGLFLIVSVLGLPLGFILLGLFFIGVYITRLFASLYIGERLLGALEHHRPPYWQSLPIGVFVFTALTSIPFLGVLFSLITIPLAFGAKFVAGRQFYQENPQFSVAEID